MSRAFRNRFVELHFEDIPSKELAKILQQKCQLPPSYAKKMVAVMKDLQVCSVHDFVGQLLNVNSCRRNVVRLLGYFLESMDLLHFEIFSVGLSATGRPKFINSFTTGNSILLRMVREILCKNVKKVYFCIITVRIHAPWRKAT